jgi:molybdopterin/thiamine biosynthesis adenylyltransferase
MITTRFQDIVSNLHEFTYHILGCGAIGSSTAIQLARMGGEKFVLYDMDKVESVNIGCSQYIGTDIGLNKVDALDQHIHSINIDVNVIKINGLFEEFWYTNENDIAILGFDSMGARLNAVQIMCKTKQKPILIIDGRMGAEQFQQYVIKNPTVDKYKKTWYSDEEGSPEPCTSKATSYCSNMSGSFIVNAIRKYATNQPYDKEIIFNFPTMFLGK